MEAEYWRGRSVLVTGATGFLGGWLLRELLARDARVVALVRREKPQSQFALELSGQEISVARGEVWDPELLDSLFVDHELDTVFHTAMSGGGVQATLAAPLECFRSTVESTWRLLDSIQRLRPRCTMVVCSSDKAYGAQRIPYREEQPLLPRHPQEVAKASQDLMTQSYGKVYGLNVAVTRCANFYGPFDFNFTRIIPYVARCAAEGVAPELRSNGQFSRDFLHIQEAAWVHLDLAQRLASTPALRGEAFNFSYGVRYRAIEIVQRVLAIAKADLKPKVNATVEHEIPDMWLSSEKARHMLGWEPAFSFEEGLESTVRWYLERFGNGRG